MNIEDTEPEIHPEIIDDAVEINKDSELIEISPIGINDLPAATSLNTAEEILPTEVLGSKIEKVFIEWIDDPTSSTLNLDWKGQGNTPKVARFRINFDLSGQNFYKEGAISMVIPKQIFHDRNGNLIGDMSLAVPELPSKKAAFAYVDLGDKYLITNTKSLSPATGAFIEGTIKGLIPSEIKDKETGYKTDKLSVNFKVDIEDPANEGTIKTMGMKSNLIDAEVDTQEKLFSTYKKVDRLYEGYTAIPKELLPENPEKYVYVEWTAYTFIEGNQHFTIDILDKTSVNKGAKGIILGYIVTSSGKVVKNNSMTDIVSEQIFDGYLDRRKNEGAFYLKFYTAYEKESMEYDVTYTLENNIEYVLTNKDDNEVIRQSDSAYKDYTPTRYIIPSGYAGFEKQGWYTDNPYLNKNEMLNLIWNDSPREYRYEGLYSYSLNELKDGKPVDISYDIQSMSFLHSATLKTNGDKENSKDYNQTPYTIDINDNQFSLDGKKLTESDDFEYKSLYIPKLDVYRYKKVTEDSFGYYEHSKGSFYMGTIYAGSYGFIKVTDDSIPLIDVFATVNGSESKVATINYKNGFINAETFNGADFIDERIIFPSNTTAYRLSVTTKESAIIFRVLPTLTIKPSEYISKKVNQLFKNSDTPQIYADNIAKFNLYTQNSNSEVISRGRDWLQGFAYGAKLEKKLVSFSNNVEDRYLLLDYQLKAITQTNITNKSTLNEVIEKGLFEDETYQTWYDLLPPGVTVKMDTIKICKNNTLEEDNGSILSKKIITNYKNSGRDLLVVKTMSNPEYIYNRKTDSILNVSGLADENILSFQAIYTWEMFGENGKLLDNVAAYESGKDKIGISESLVGEPDNPRNNNHRDSTLISDYYDILTDLNPEHDRPVFMYTKSTDNVYADTWAILSLYKYVSVNNDGSYGDGREEAYAKNVYEGGPYEYRLTVKNPRNAESKNIIFYDNLESFIPTKFDKHGNKTNNNDAEDTQWKGEFIGIDTRQLERVGANPVIYYSTIPGLDLSWRQNDQEEKNPDLDLSRSDIWTTVKPDSKKITAIAIDISKDKDGNEFILEKDSSVSTFIKMRAPLVKNLSNPGEEDLWYDTMNDGKFDESGLNSGAHAYNDASVSFNSISETGQISADAFTNNSYTKVGLRLFKINVEKSFNDDNNRDGIRPKEIKIKLVKNSRDIIGEILLNSENDFKGSFISVPYLDETGTPISYSIEEDSKEGYRFEYTGKNHDNGLTFKAVNIHEPERINIRGLKRFIGANPVPVIIKLYKNGELFKTQVVNKSNNYNYSFDNLFKFEEGKEIKYEVREEYVPGFITSHDDSDIVNTYHPYGDLVIKKELTNDTAESEDKVFTINIEFLDKDGNIDSSIYNYESSNGTKGTITTGAELKIKKNEVITIKDVKSDGNYTIKEVNIPSGFTLDKENSKNLNGSLKAGETVNALLVNDYKTTTKFVPEAKKELKNRNLGNYQFIFEMLDKDMNIIKAGSNMKDGKVIFSPLLYTNEDLGKTFIYYIRERNTKYPGYTYDNSLKKITVTPKDNGDGTITADYKYADVDSGDIKSGNNFINEYNAKGTLNLKAFKSLIAHELKDDQFEFELYGDKPHGHKGVGDKLSIKAKNNAAGIIDFNINFDEQDIGKTFVFRAKEIAGNDDTMIYDNTEVEYTVKVYDKGNGSLSFDASVRDLDTTIGNEETTPLFINRYKNGSLTIEKVIQGAYEGQKVFKFIVKFIGEKEVLPNGTINISRSELAPKFNFVLGKYTKANENVEFYETEFDISKPVKGKELKLPTITQPSNDVAKYGFSFTNNEEYYDNEIFTNIKYNVDDKGDVTKVKAVNSEGTPVDITDKIKINNAMFIQALSSRMFFKNEDGIVTIYPENGIVAENNGRYISTSDDKSIPIDIKEVRGDGKLLFKGSLETMFHGHRAAKLDLSHFDTSKVTSMQAMFYASGATSVDLSSFDTGNVTNMNMMFNYFQGTRLDLSRFNTSSVTDMSKMFSNSKAATLDLSSFNTGNVINMSNMFSEAQATKIDVSSFDTRNVKYMGGMFYCSQATTLDLSNFDTTNVTDMGWMFYKSEATTLDLSNFDTTNVTDMGWMFYKSETTTLDLSSFDTSNVADMTNMFYNSKANKVYVRTQEDKDKMSKSVGCTVPEDNFIVGKPPVPLSSNLKPSNLNGFQSTRAAGNQIDKNKYIYALSKGYITENNHIVETTVKGGVIIDLFDNNHIVVRPANGTKGELITSQYESITKRYYSMAIGPVSVSFEPEVIVKYDLYGRFTESKIDFIDFTNFNTSDVKDTRFMFAISKVNKIIWSDFDAKNIIDASEMFDNVIVKELNLSQLKTNNLELMNSMFAGVKADNVSINSLNTKNVKQMAGMFEYATIQNLDLGNIQTDKLKITIDMFKNSRIDTIDLSSFNMANVEMMTGMFSGAQAKKIVLPPSFRFKDNVKFETFTELPYTGKWIREDKTFLPYTADELATTFNSDPDSYAGSWIAEKYPPFTIKYDNNGELGRMEDSSIDINDKFTIPEPSFTSYGSQFVSWNTSKDGSGTRYMPGQVLSNIVLDQSGQTMILYAQWEELSSFKKIGDNMYEILIPGNSKVTIDNLAAGLKYEIYEETEDGWVLVKAENATGTIKPLENTKATFTNEKTNDKVSVSLKASKLLDGKAVDGYKFELLKDNEVIDTATSVEGVITFKPIVFEKVGEYNYSIREVKGDDPGIVYDEKVENIKITVTRNDKDMLVATASDNANNITFNNNTKRVKLNLSLENLIPNKYLVDKEPEGYTPYNNSENETFTFEVYINDVKVDKNVTIKGDGKVTLNKEDGIDIKYGDKVTIKEVKLPEAYRLKGFEDSEIKEVTIDKLIKDTSVKATNIYEPKGFYNLDVNKNMIGREAVDGEFFYKVTTYDTKGNVIDTPLAENKINSNIDTSKNTDLSDAEMIKTIKDDLINYPKYTKDELTTLSEKLLNGKYDSNIRTNINSKIFEDILFAKIKMSQDKDSNNLYINKSVQYIAISELPYNINMDDNINFDTEPIIAKVIGTDDGKGNIITTVEYISEKQTFNNSLKSGSLKITKTIDGRNNKDFEHEIFKVKIKLLDINGVELADSYKMGNKTIKSGDIIELNPGIPVVIEGLPHGASYELTEEERPYYELSKKSTLTGKIEAGKESEVSVINIYKPSGEVIIRGYKTLENADISNYKFSFLLLKDKEIIAEAYNDAEGNFEFPAIKLKEEDVGKTFEYKVIETPGNIKNIKYDDSEQIVKFTVINEGGKLMASFNNDDIPTDMLITEFTADFNNVYIDTAKLQLIKTGENDKPLAGAEFEVLDENKNNVMINDQKVIITTDAEGNGNLIDGLTIGTYYLNETKVPEGYIKADLVKFKIDSSDLNDTKVVKVRNKKLAVLPTTGLLEEYYSIMFIFALITIAFVYRRRYFLK